MGQELKLSDEALTLAAQFAEMTGEAPDVAVVQALRELVRRERDRQEELRAIRKMAKEFRALFDDASPSSDHSWLYDDETGLPI